MAAGYLLIVIAVGFGLATFALFRSDSQSSWASKLVRPILNAFGYEGSNSVEQGILAAGLSILLVVLSCLLLVKRNVGTYDDVPSWRAPWRSHYSERHRGLWWWWWNKDEADD